MMTEEEEQERMGRDGCLKMMYNAFERRSFVSC